MQPTGANAAHGRESTSALTIYHYRCLGRDVTLRAREESAMRVEATFGEAASVHRSLHPRLALGPAERPLSLRTTGGGVPECLFLEFSNSRPSGVARKLCLKGLTLKDLTTRCSALPAELARRKRPSRLAADSWRVRRGRVFGVAFRLGAAPEVSLGMPLALSFACVPCMSAACVVRFKRHGCQRLPSGR